jgi:toxin-antitoxin system PIN domain toxin
VILVDTNLLVFSHNADAEQHIQSRQWLEQQFASGARVGLPWHSLLGFIRLVSNPKIYSKAESPRDAWQQVRDWLILENVWIPQPTERHVRIMDEMFKSTRIGTQDVMDVHLAALAIEHGLILCSTDRDFVRYPTLRWFNPLAA